MKVLMRQRRQALEEKNNKVFGELAGYPLPEAEDTEFIVGSAILLALHQQCAVKPSIAIGEKTPENAFFFLNLKRLFPQSKCIGIVRDPRDAFTSAWHFFPKPRPDRNEAATKMEFVRHAIPSFSQGVQAMLEFQQRYPDDCMIATYEDLSADPKQTVARLYRLIGVTDTPEIVARCIEQTSFAAMAGGRPPGVEMRGSFLRKGVIGDWSSTLSSEMSELVLHELGWMFARFGWKP